MVNGNTVGENTHQTDQFVRAVITKEQEDDFVSSTGLWPFTAGTGEPKLAGLGSWAPRRSHREVVKRTSHTFQASANSMCAGVTWWRDDPHLWRSISDETKIFNTLWLCPVDIVGF
jgi:hypothetical protein